MKRGDVNTERAQDKIGGGGDPNPKDQHLTHQVNQLLSDRIEGHRGSAMVNEAELANQKILEESSRNEWDESLHSNQLVMSQSLKNKQIGRGSVTKVGQRKMGGTFKSPKGVGLSSEIGISEENKSVSNSYS